MTQRTCIIKGCSRKHFGRGWCQSHYNRWRNHGDPMAGGGKKYATPEESFRAHTRREGDCLIWTGATKRHGYGVIRAEGRMVHVHRYAWERANGPIPEGVEVDHICHNRSCVNVEHLRLASRQQNTWNRSGPMARNAVGVRNVYQKRGKFNVSIMKNGKVHTAGPFLTLDAAAASAHELRAKLFGQFAGRG